MGLPIAPELADGLVDLRVDPNDPNAPLHITKCTVSAVSPTTGTVTIRTGGSVDVAGVPYAAGLAPAVNDVVLVLESDAAPFVFAIVANPAGSGATGEVRYTRSTTAPTGWLFANGGAIASQYTGLIALVGANTPDLRDRVIIGAGNLYALAATGGAASSTALLAHTHTQDSHTHTQSSHTHTQNAHNHTQQLGNGAGGSTSVQIVGGLGYPASGGDTANTTATNQSTTATNNSTTATNQSTGSGSSFSLLNPYHALNPIIRAF